MKEFLPWVPVSGHFRQQRYRRYRSGIRCKIGADGLEKWAYTNVFAEEGDDAIEKKRVNDSSEMWKDFGGWEFELRLGYEVRAYGVSIGAVDYWEDFGVGHRSEEEWE